MIKLSILMLTHNRPALFQRAIASVLGQLPDGVEIIVNNDSNDITELQHPKVTYYYNKYENLSGIYKFLLSQAQGTHIYYLEDDDYLLDGFFETVMPLLDNDIIAGNHYPTYNDTFIARTTRMFHEHKPFVLNKEDMQLSQFVMRKSLVETFVFPNDSHIHNDCRLVEHVIGQSTKIYPTAKLFFVQTTDGGDNISFPESPNYYGI